VTTRRPGVRPGARTGRAVVPTLREERRLLREGGHALVAGVDEVGRGALAGPVSVGVVVVRETTRTAPSGLRDSKLLTPAAREALTPALRRWAPAWAVGHAEPEEIDAVGIIAALRLAGRRALAQLALVPELVLLDGSHDWLTVPVVQETLFDVPDALPGPGAPLFARDGVPDPGVRTMVKADLRCAAVAAASVLAKTTRDAMMTERSAAHPEYGWHGNKGYSAPDHLEALLRYGPCAQHRRSWRLPGCEPVGSEAAHDDAHGGGAEAQHDVGGHVEPGPADVPLLDESYRVVPEAREGGEGAAEPGAHEQDRFVRHAG
jgi:ribonuclease HII